MNVENKKKSRAHYNKNEYKKKKLAIILVSFLNSYGKPDSKFKMEGVTRIQTA
jgi:hypothetical protein